MADTVSRAMTAPRAIAPPACSTGDPCPADAPGAARWRRGPLGRYRFVRLRWRVLVAAIDTLGGALFGLVRRLSRRRAPSPDVRPGGTVLLVQWDHLGDGLLTTAMLPALRAQYPEASLEVLAAPWNREVFENAPEVNRVHVSHVNRFARGGWLRLGWLAGILWWGLTLRRRQIDLAIDVRGELPMALLLWLSGARRRLGWGCGGGGFLLTDIAPWEPDRPEVESRRALLRTIGIDPASLRVPDRPSFHPAEAARKAVAERRPWSDTAGPRVVIHVGAGTAAKTYPAERWREVIGRLIVERNAQVVLVGSPADRATAGRILEHRTWPRVADWTGTLRLAETAALIEQADLFVGADSGPAHLAAAVNTPAVVLFSGTNRIGQWCPWGPAVTVVHSPVACSPCHRHVCPLADHPCMRNIRPDEIVRAAAAFLQEERTAPNLQESGKGKKG